jgi:hypothetical protein
MEPCGGRVKIACKEKKTAGDGQFVFSSVSARRRRSIASEIPPSGPYPHARFPSLDPRKREKSTCSELRRSFSDPGGYYSEPRGEVMPEKKTKRKKSESKEESAERERKQNVF